jgi:hypothetical protein
VRSNVRAELNQARCESHLKELSLAFRQFADDNGDRFPMAVSRRMGGAREDAWEGRISGIAGALAYYQPHGEFFTCPGDSRVPGESTGALTSSNISYFVNLAADRNGPSVLLGDRDLVMKGGGHGAGQIVTGVQDFGASRQEVDWSGQSHRRIGNVVLTDGTVLRPEAARLSKALRPVDDSAARLLFPQ